MTNKIKKLKNVDYSKKENQIGCGYCIREDQCLVKDKKKINEGCKDFKHWKN